MFFSTRNSAVRISASEAILKGISSEGGLFLPERIEELDYRELIGKSYQEIAFSVLRKYLDDYSDEEIKEAVEKAYSNSNFPEKIAAVASYSSYSFLELFHGQTLTFKDMALSVLPHLMETALKKHQEESKIHILTATSGDTGSGVLSSFKDSKNISVSVLYPDNGISYIQEKQMLSFTSSSSRAYALKDGNFDDCQNLVKKLLLSKPFKENYSSANSINIGRLLPQIIYYYYAYLRLAEERKIKLGEKIDVVVPTGNFGDIFAAYLAKRMSLPFNKLIVASNENKVLTDFFNTGIYDIRRKFVKTNSPSMDILISSNLERLIYLTCLSDKKVADYQQELKEQSYFMVSKEELKKLKEDFLACSADEKETKEAISVCFKNNHYLLDPHTGVAFASYLKLSDSLKGHTLIVSTASPLKFPLTIASALGFSASGEKEALEKTCQLSGLKVPPQLQKAMLTICQKKAVREEEFISALAEKKTVFVKAPCSTANLGPGFDVLGLSLNLYNVFSFKKEKEDSLEGFKGAEEVKDNLILKSYKRLFEKYGFAYQPVRIKMEKNEVPLSRGLGSSSTCIVSGLIGANAILNYPLSREEIIKTAEEIEGHPDNVACCCLGGLVASFKDGEGRLISRRLPLSHRLGFLIVIPHKELSTEAARKVLLKEYPLSTVTYDASRLTLLPSALKEGNIDLLFELLKDKIHVPYRLPLIEEGKTVEEISEKYHLPFTISGAGSSLLLLFDKKDKSLLDKALAELKQKISKTCDFKILVPSFKGAEIREEKEDEQ